MVCLRIIEMSGRERGEHVGEELGEACVGVCMCVGRSHRTWLAVMRAFLSNILVNQEQWRGVA